MGVCHTPFVLVQRTESLARACGCQQGRGERPAPANTDSANPLQTHFQALCPRGPGVAPCSPLGAVSSSPEPDLGAGGCCPGGSLLCMLGRRAWSPELSSETSSLWLSLWKSREILGGWGGGGIPLLCQARRPPGGAGTSPPRLREGKAPRHPGYAGCSALVRRLVILSPLSSWEVGRSGASSLLTGGWRGGPC